MTDDDDEVGRPTFDADGHPTPEALDRMRYVLRGYAMASRERDSERKWWAVAALVALVVGYVLGWVLS